MLKYTVQFACQAGCALSLEPLRRFNGRGNRNFLFSFEQSPGIPSSNHLN
jgi:hypothetical protein